MALTKEERIAKHEQEYTAYVEQFYRTSWDWRSQAYHANWDRYQRNYMSIYPPELKARKESWQSVLFDPESFKVVEIIAASVTKILFGRTYPLSLEPREFGDRLQAELHTELLDFEQDKCDLAVAFYDAFKESLIYGSGFLKTVWIKRFGKRRLKRAIKRGFKMAMGELMKGNYASPSDTIGFDEELKDMLIEDNAKVFRVHTRDIFLEPNSQTMARVLERRKMTYGDIVTMSKEKDKDGNSIVNMKTVERLRLVNEGDNFEVDVAPVLLDQGITDPTLARTDFSRNHTIWEFWGDVPRKWIELDMDDESDEANEMVPGKLMTVSGKWPLASEMNPYQCMEPPYTKIDYIRIGQTYGMGVCQAIEGLQTEKNELINQRLDNATLIMNKIIVIFEKSILNADEMISEPGAVWRLKGSPQELDINKVMKPIEFPDIHRSAYQETGEIERKIQETTAANRVTLGTAGQTGDTNQTLGGMELLRQAAADRFTLYAYIIGRATMIKQGQKLMEFIYQYSSPERIRRILGEKPIEILPGQIIPKWRAFKLQPPSDIVMDYDFKVVDVFNMENKLAKATQKANYLQLVAQLKPQFNPDPGLRQIGEDNGFDADELNDILGVNSGPIPGPMMSGLGMSSMPKPNKTMGGPPSPTQSSPLGQALPNNIGPQ